MGSALLPGPRIPILRDGLLKARKGEERERENRRTERSKHTQRDRERKTHRERQRERENRRTERSKHTERERHRKIEMYTDSLLLHGYVCGPLTASFICFILFILCSTSCLLAFFRPPLGSLPRYLPYSFVSFSSICVTFDPAPHRSYNFLASDNMARPLVRLCRCIMSVPRRSNAYASM